MFRQKSKDVQKALPVDNTFYRTRYRVFFEWLRNLMRKFIIRDFPFSEGSLILGRPCLNSTSIRFRRRALAIACQAGNWRFVQPRWASQSSRNPDMALY